MTHFAEAAQPELSSRELATVLAALRLWQRNMGAGAGRVVDAFPQLEGFEPLDDEEIDELCERLNFGG